MSSFLAASVAYAPTDRVWNQTQQAVIDAFLAFGAEWTGAAYFAPHAMILFAVALTFTVVVLARVRRVA